MLFIHQYPGRSANNCLCLHLLPIQEKRSGTWAFNVTDLSIILQCKFAAAHAQTCVALKQQHVAAWKRLHRLSRWSWNPLVSISVRTANLYNISTYRSFIVKLDVSIHDLLAEPVSADTPLPDQWIDLDYDPTQTPISTIVVDQDNVPLVLHPPQFLPNRSHVSQFNNSANATKG